VNVNELDGRVAIVTGGAGGLGRGIAQRFVAVGARVVIADLNVGPGKELAESLGPAAVFRAVDVADPDDVGDLVEFTLTAFGGLHVMVNNAGVSGTMHRSFLDDDLADFGRVMGVNVLGVLAGTKHAARHMATAGGGSIINVSSAGSLRPAPDMLPYAAAKAGLNALTEGFAKAFGPTVRVNTLMAGPFLTDISKAWNLDKATVNPFTHLSLKRAGNPPEIVGAALYLMSDASSYTTGTILRVDGGIP
jgi:NAD(P)-dependent dehydrogenase (short-subunit alcohol dehydrogenase family)